MAKFSQKWKKRTLTVLSLALVATLSLGALSACATTDPDDDDETVASKTDTQRIKNGNFEFYGDKNIEDSKKKLNLINTPDSWTFSSGSPTSDTKSGVVAQEDWDYLTRTGGYKGFTDVKVGDDDDEDAKTVRTFASVKDAYEHFEDDDVSAYDRLAFFYAYEDEIDDLDKSSAEAELFAKYKYSIDFEDVEKLREEIGDKNALLREGHNEDETSVLMIHNSRTSDDIRGTAQYYTSSTTITLTAGTAAEVSVWVKTANLYHYADTQLTKRGGAYIGVTNTVGGTTLDQMQIYNINTEGAWKKYTVYVRASTFATTTFRIVLGLGQGSSDDRYYHVDGYAFFDDVTCNLMSGKDYETKVRESGAHECYVDSLKKEKQFPVDNPPYSAYDSFALDLYAGFETGGKFFENVSIALTEEISGSNKFNSGKIDPSLGHISENFAEKTTLGGIAGNSNKYLKKIYENDLKDKYPFGGDNSNIIMLMSSNGAAYTAKITSDDFRLEPNTRMLISFFVKTSAIETGLSGASATIVDGANKNIISAFDSTKIAQVDIDSKSENDEDKDIYKGWAQCFFFLENDTDEARTFDIELSYGPTTIVGTNKFSYGDGYAAFTNFETKLLTKTEYSYASTNDRAKKVSLTGGVEETKNFDSVSATAEKDLEQGPALPANFRGVLGGSNYVVDGGAANEKPANVDAGLLNAKYAENYFTSPENWKNALREAAGNAGNAKEWWTNLFGNARQPLVIINREEAAYGYFAETATVSASAYRRISMRVKVSVGAKAYIYLTDVSSAEKSGQLIYPNMPGYTYWYDDDGNICRIDPSDDDFNEDTDILYELQSNGLYTKAGDTSSNPTYYANLHNYEVDKATGDLLAKDGTIAYFAKEKTGGGYEYYAYRDEDTDELSQLVQNLPTDIARYKYAENELPGTQIIVDGTGDWVTVNFYVRTGNEAKNYRLEVWSGDRTGEVKNPAGSYVFFDNYSAADASSVYNSLVKEAVNDLKDRINDENGKTLGDDGYLGDKDNLPETYADGTPLARYYTFTFFDSTSYLRYDETEDEDELGNPWGSYKQSKYEEQLAFLYYIDEDESTSYSFFLDYSAVDVTVNPDDLGDNSSSTDKETDDDVDIAQILTLVSSGLLAVVLLAIMVIMVVRILVKKYGKKTKVKASKDKRFRPDKKAEEAPVEEESAAPAEVPDENDPYNN